MSEILKIENLYFNYGNTKNGNKNNKFFLKNINIVINEGEMISVIGKNGSGKTTLFKTINGILKNYKGNILYKGKDIKKLTSLEKAKEIAVLYQNNKCDFPFSCFEIVSMGLYPHKSNLIKMRKQDIDFITNIMESTNTIHLACKDINRISGGQAQRVLLARALAQKPKLLFLDEAMSGLDISSRIQMTKLLYNERKTKGTTTVSVSHDINLAFEKSDKIIALKDGEVHSFGKPEELLNKDFFREVFNVEVEIDTIKKRFRIIYDSKKD